MIKDHLRQPFELVLKEPMEECTRGIHQHIFFELVYIVDGSGTQTINQSLLPYKKDNLFLLAPQDTHTFHIKRLSTFFFIRFNGGLLKSAPGDGVLLSRLEAIFTIAGKEHKCLADYVADPAAVNNLIAVLLKEATEKRMYHDEITTQLIKTLLAIIARDITGSYTRMNTEAGGEPITHMYEYIQENIYCPEKLKTGVMSQQFNMAENYLGRYFKKHAGESLQDYIQRCKIQLIENRLRFTGMRITEIVQEFGFTDKSHLNRFFKKYRQ